MKNFSQIFLLIFLSSLAIGLGVLAYRLASDTLWFAFEWEQNQRWQELVVAVDLPWTLSRIIPPWTLLDEEVIRSSILKNGIPLDPEQENFEIFFTESFVKITPKNAQEGDIFTLSAELYNAQKKTAYRLPSDISVTISQDSQKIHIQEATDFPKDGKFLVQFPKEFYQNFSSENILWHVYYPAKGEDCSEVGSLWNARKYTKTTAMKTETISKNDKNYDIFVVEFNSNTPRQCLLAGFAGDIQLVVDRSLPKFSLEGAVTSMLTPQDDLKTQVQFSSESVLVPEGLLDNSDLKKEIFQKIAISPSIDLNEDDIILSKNSISLIGGFQEGKKYTVHLTDMEDIYGRHASANFAFTPSSEPFLDLQLKNHQTNFYSSDEISGKIFAISTPKDAYEIKICRLDVEAFSQISKIYANRDEEKIAQAYNLMNSEHASNCQKATIPLAEGSMLTEFAFSDIFDKNLLNPGLYVLAFRNQDEISKFSKMSLPKPFVISQNEIVGQVLSNGVAELRVLDSQNLKTFSNQEIEIFAINTDENNAKKYATGSIIGKTNEQGILSFDAWKFENQEIFLVARWEGRFGYFEGKIGENFLEKTPYNARIFMNGEDFLLGTKLNFSAIITKDQTFDVGEFFRIQIKDSDKNILKETIQKPNEFGVISWEYQFSSNAKTGSYVIEIFSENEKNLVAQKNLTITASEKQIFQISPELKILNLENNSPRNLKETVNSEKNLHYSHMYSADLQVELIVRASDDTGKNLKNFPFEYTIFHKKSPQSQDAIERISEWKGKIGDDGVGLLTLPLNFQSTYADEEYFAEIRIQDPKTGKIISEKTAKNIVKIPENLKTFDDTITPNFSLENEVLKEKENITFRIDADIWSDSMKNKYRYEILDSAQNMVKSDIIDAREIIIDNSELSGGIFTIRILPITPESILPPENTIAERKFLIQSNEPVISNNLEIFANYRDNKADIFVVAPKTSGQLFFSSVQNNKIISEVLPVSKNITHREFLLDKNNSRILNVLALDGDKKSYFAQKILPSAPSQVSEKIEITGLENTLTGTANSVEIAVMDQENKPIHASVMIEIFEGEHFSEIDAKNIFTENNPMNISFFGNIFQKNISAIPLQNVEISQNFRKNIAFFPSILTDRNGKIKIDFSLPNDNKKYTIRTIAHTKDGKIIQNSKRFSVQKKFDLQAQIPGKIFVWDRPEILLQAKNLTNKIRFVDVKLEFMHPENPQIYTGSLILNIGKWENLSISPRFPSDWNGEISYKVSLSQENDILQTITWSLHVEKVPTMGLTRTTLGAFSGTTDIKLFESSLYDKEKSQIQIAVGSDLSILLPRIIEDLKNSSKADSVQILQDLLARQQIANTERFSNLIDSDELSRDLENFFNQNSAFLTMKNSSEKNLEIIELLARLAKNRAKIPVEKLNFVKQFLEENFSEKIAEKNLSEQLKIFLIQILLETKRDENFWNNLDIEAIRWENAFIYADILLAKNQKIPDRILQEIQYFANNNDADVPIPNSPFERIVITTRMYLEVWKLDEAMRLIHTYVLKASEGAQSIHQNLLLTELAIAHAKKTDFSDTKIKFSSEKISGEDVITKLKNRISWEISRAKIADILALKTDSKTPIFYEIREKNVLEAPALFPAQDSEYLKISQRIEKIFEEAGLDENGEYRLREEISDNYLEQDALYKATIEVSVTDTYDKKWKNLITKISPLAGAEIFFPTERPKDFLWKIFKWDFAKINFQKNAILVEKNGWQGDTKFSYLYYFRPKMRGSYLLPANFVYFIEDREFFANNSHHYFHVK